MTDHLLITTCTNRKRLPPIDGLRGRDLQPSHQSALASAWLDRLDRIARAPSGTRANELYCGRGFREAIAACADPEEVLIISAGLGLVRGRDEVPSYSLTISGRSSDSLLPKIIDEFDPTSWWRSLHFGPTSKGSLADIVPSLDHSIVVMAMSSNYWQLIEEDVLRLRISDQRRLRIVGIPSNGVSDAVHHLVMPYDDRLDGPDGDNRGTRGDFPQRAARHFVERILNEVPGGSPADHRAAVSSAIQTMRIGAKPKRQRMTDEEITNEINCNWEKVGGRSGRMLRYLRDEMGVACEQGRFKKLFTNVRKNRLGLNI